MNNAVYFCCCLTGDQVVLALLFSHLLRFFSTVNDKWLMTDISHGCTLPWSLSIKWTPKGRWTPLQFYTKSNINTIWCIINLPPWLMFTITPHCPNMVCLLTRHLVVSRLLSCFACLSESSLLNNLKRVDGWILSAVIISRSWRDLLSSGHLHHHQMSLGVKYDCLPSWSLWIFRSLKRPIPHLHTLELCGWAVGTEFGWNLLGGTALLSAFVLVFFSTVEIIIRSATPIPCHPFGLCVLLDLWVYVALFDI